MGFLSTYAAPLQICKLLFVSLVLEASTLMFLFQLRQLYCKFANCFMWVLVLEPYEVISAVMIWFPSTYAALFQICKLHSSISKILGCCFWTWLEVWAWGQFSAKGKNTGFWIRERYSAEANTSYSLAERVAASPKNV